MFCSKCGAELPEGAKFCGKCAAPVPGMASSAGVPGASGVAGAQGATPGATQGATPGFASGAPVGATPSVSTKERGKKVLIGLVAVVAVVVVLVAGRGLLGGLFGGGRSSADAVMENLEKAYEDMFRNFSSDGEDAYMAYGKAIFDEMPPQVLDAVLEDQDLTREEAEEAMADAGSYMASSLDSYKDDLAKIDIAIACTAGDRLDDSDIDDLNEFFEEIGANAVVTDGREIGMDVTYTAKEDVSGLDKGESKDMSLGSMGLCVIEIDGSWYLWSTMFTY